MDLLALVTGLVPALVDKIKPKHEPEVEEANAKALEPPPLPEFSYRPLTTGYDGRPVIWNLENHPEHWMKTISGDTGEFESFYHQPSAHTFHIGREGAKDEAYVYAVCQCSNQKVADLKGLRAAFGKWKEAGRCYRGGAVPNTREESWYGHFVYR